MLPVGHLEAVRTQPPPRTTLCGASSANHCPRQNRPLSSARAEAIPGPAELHHPNIGADVNRKLLTTGLAVIGLTLAAALTPATAALADNVGSMPSGCSATPRTPGLSSTKKVTYGGS